MEYLLTGIAGSTDLENGLIKIKLPDSVPRISIFVYSENVVLVII